MTASVFLSAGHEVGGGASANGLRENPYNAFVVVLSARALEARGLTAHVVPVTRSPYPREIQEKTEWIRARARPGDLAVDVHLDINEPGSAAYARDTPGTLAAAETVAEEVARATGLACRGGRPEYESGPGRLGFLHALPCEAVVVELCSLNTSDVWFALRPDAPARFAHGLAEGCAAVLAGGGVMASRAA